MIELIDRENHQKLYLQLLSIIKKKIEGGGVAYRYSDPDGRRLVQNVQCKQGNGENRRS